MRDPGPEDPALSVVLPVVHGGRFLEGALASLRGADLSPDRFEVLVAGPAEDVVSRRIATEAATASPFPVRYVAADGARRSESLNAACAVAKGAVLVFGEDDCLFPADWLAKYQAAFRDEPGTDMIGGADVLEPSGSAFDLALDVVLGSTLMTGRLGRTSGLRLAKDHPRLFNMAVRPEAARAASGRGPEMTGIFDQRLDVHEDLDLARRIEGIGGRVVAKADIIVRHVRDTDFRSVLARNVVLGRTCRSLGVQRTAHLLLVLIFFGLAALAAGAILDRRFALPLAALAGAYVLPILAVGLGGLLRTGRPAVLLFSPALIVGLHGARIAGYLLPGPPRPFGRTGR